MRADPYPLKQVLSWERRYVIPTFQRDYEWTRDGQWELLADDLESVAERLGSERHHAEVTGTSAAQADERVSPHFLGAIVLDRLVPLKAGGLDLRSVIDGQQRLTTLQLLVRALLDVALEADSPRIRQLRRLLRNPDDVADNAEEIHKLWPRRRDRTIWVQAMADEPADDTAQHPYLQARAYFAGRIRTAAAAQAELPISLDLIVDACLDLFRIVVIDLDDNDDAQVIFEVLNGRQTPLSSADLVKNLLFLRAEQQKVSDVEELYETHWSQFDDEWWKQTVGRGHAARRHSSILLSAWLTAVMEEAAHPDRLYGQVRRYVDQSNAKIADVVQDISTYAGHYRVYQGQPVETDARIAMAFDRMGALGSTTALPVVLALRDAWSKGDLALDDYREAVVAVESYLVRRVAVGANTRGYGQTFREILVDARAGLETGQGLAAGVTAALMDLDGSAAWPTDEEVTQAFVDRRFYDNVAQYLIRLLLSGIEEHKRAAQTHTEQIRVDYDALTIEHILPQSWRSHWGLQGEGAELVIAQQRRDGFVHRMGNLTMINGSFNSAQSNKPWAAKREELARFSSLRLNAELVSDPTWDTWDEGAISRRARELAVVACMVWPRPTSEQASL